MTKNETTKKIICYRKCKFCGAIENTIVKSENVNTGLSDSDIQSMARRFLGTIETWKCDGCNNFTAQEVVAYNLFD